MYFFFARTRGRVWGAVRKGAGRDGRVGLSPARRRRDACGPPSPAPPGLVTLVAFMTPGAGWGSAAAPGSAGVRARVGAAELQPGRRARPPRRGAPAGGAGAAGAADRCGGRREPRAPPLRPPPPVWPLCRARTGERASEREKYKYGRPRQWEKRPGHFLPARAAENGLVECAGASPRRVLCVCAAERPPRLPPRTRTLTRTHTLTDPRRGSAAESLRFLPRRLPLPDRLCENFI